jgi:hypothetical protein
MSGTPKTPQRVVTAEEVAAYQNSQEYLAAANASPPSSEWGDTEDGINEEAGPSTSMSATLENSLNGNRESSISQQNSPQIIEQNLKTEKLQHEADTAKGATNDTQKMVKFRKDEDLDLRYGSQSYMRMWMPRERAINELASMWKLVALIPGPGLPEEKLRGYLTDTLDGFKTKAIKLAHAQRQIQLLNNSLKRTEDECDRRAGEVGWYEDQNAYLNNELEQLEAVQLAYQHHALFHPPLGEYERLTLENANLREELAGAARGSVHLPVGGERSLVLVQSEIRSISILPETSSASLPALLVNQPNAPPRHKKTHRAGKKHKKPHLGRNPSLQASQEDASDGDLMISPVAASASNDSAGVSLHSVDVTEDMEDEVEDSPVDGYPFASWYEPRQETTIEEEEEEDEVVNNDISIQHHSSEETPSKSKPSKFEAFVMILLSFMLFGLATHTAFVRFGSATYSIFSGSRLIFAETSVNVQQDVVNLSGINSFYYSVSNMVNMETYGQLSPESLIEVPTNKSLVEVMVKENLDEAPDPILIYRLASKLFTANRMPPVSFTRQLRELENTVAPTLQIFGRAWGSW